MNESRYSKYEDLKIIRKQLSRLLELYECVVLNRPGKNMRTRDSFSQFGKNLYDFQSSHGKCFGRSHKEKIPSANEYKTYHRGTTSLLRQHLVETDYGNTGCHRCLATRTQENRNRDGRRTGRQRNSIGNSLNSSIEYNAAYDADSESGMNIPLHHCIGYISGIHNNATDHEGLHLQVKNTNTFSNDDNKLLHIMQWRDALCRAFRATDKLLERRKLAEKDEGYLAEVLAHIRTEILKKLHISNEAIKLLMKINNKEENRVEKYLHLK